MSERRWWIGILSGGLLCAAGLCTVIYLQYEKIAEGRTGIASLKQNIEGSRKLIEGTSTLERDVIVLRELSEVMKGILPDTEDVYEPKKDAKAVKIDGYERKRELLLGEINRRREGLSISTYAYRGARGRRDPWIDPRVPAQPDNPSQLTVQQQMDLVQEFVEKVQTCSQKWGQVKIAENVIVEMMARQE